MSSHRRTSDWLQEQHSRHFSLSPAARDPWATKSTSPRYFLGTFRLRMAAACFVRDESLNSRRRTPRTPLSPPRTPMGVARCILLCLRTVLALTGDILEVYILAASSKTCCLARYPRESASRTHSSRTWMSIIAGTPSRSRHTNSLPRTPPPPLATCPESPRPTPDAQKTRFHDSSG